MHSAASRSGPPPVAIVLVNWNNWRDCIENIDSVLAQDYPAFHIFIVDNDSSDQSLEHIRAWCAMPTPGAGWRRHNGVARWTDRDVPRPVPVRQIDSLDDAAGHAADGARVTLVRSGANRGFAGGCNVGIRCAGLDRYAYFWLLNTDTVVHRDALRHLVARADRDVRIGMVGSTVCFYDRPGIVQALGGATWDVASASARHIGEGRRLPETALNGAEIEASLSFVFGASMLVTGRLIREVGPMREDYFLFYEEIDWAMRSRGSFALGYAPLSRVFHKTAGSSFKVLPLLTARYFYRSRIKFVSRFYPRRLGAVRRALLYQVLRLALRGRWAMAGAVAGICRDAGKIARDAVAADTDPSSPRCGADRP